MEVKKELVHFSFVYVKKKKKMQEFWC